MEVKKDESSSKKNKNRIDEFDDIDMSKLNVDQKKMVNQLKDDYRSKEIENFQLQKTVKISMEYIMYQILFLWEMEQILNLEQNS